MTKYSLQEVIDRPEPGGKSFNYNLDRAERAMSGRYPMLMLTYGCILAMPLYLVLTGANAIVLFYSEYNYELGELIGRTGVTVAISIMFYFYYSKTMHKT
jgi:hypothetical protein